MSRSLSQQAFLRDIAQLIIYAELIGIDLTAGEAYRTDEQQEIHRRHGVSRVRRSQHQDRLAMDFNFFYLGKWIPDPRKEPPGMQDLIRKLGEFWEGLHKDNRWGGRFGVKKEDYHSKIGWDSNHYERKG